MYTIRYWFQGKEEIGQDYPTIDAALMAYRELVRDGANSVILYYTK